jgi:hypothetical protein
VLERADRTAPARRQLAAQRSSNPGQTCEAEISFGDIDSTMTLAWDDLGKGGGGLHGDPRLVVEIVQGGASWLGRGTRFVAAIRKCDEWGSLAAERSILNSVRSGYLNGAALVVAVGQIVRARAIAIAAHLGG